MEKMKSNPFPPSFSPYQSPPHISFPPPLPICISPPPLPPSLHPSLLLGENFYASGENLLNCGEFDFWHYQKRVRRDRCMSLVYINIYISSFQSRGERGRSARGNEWTRVLEERVNEQELSKSKSTLHVAMKAAKRCLWTRPVGNWIWSEQVFFIN